VLSVLYFAQGLPFGFQAKALPLFLRSQGVSLTHIGFLGWLSAPWVFKVVWAPLVDRYGTKQQWIRTMQLALTACCLLAALTVGTLPVTLVLVFLMNLCAATQDIAVDGLAIELVEPEDLGWANSAQIVGFKVGMLLGGGVLVWGSTAVGTGWAGVFAAMAVLMLAALACVTTLGATIGGGDTGAGAGMQDDRSSSPASYTPPHISENEPPTADLATTVGSVLHRLVDTPHSRAAAVLVVTYKMGESLGDAMFKPLLLDSGVDAGTISMWSGVYGMGWSIAGSLAGGWCARRWPLLQAVGYALLVRVLPQVLRLMVATTAAAAAAAATSGVVGNSGGDVGGEVGVGMEQTMVLGTMCFESFVGGLLSTCMFAWMMSLVNKEASGAASHFAALTTLEVAGKSVASTFSGVLADSYGYVSVFQAAVVLSVGCLAVLPALHRTDQP
jgi:MFS family permease